MMAPSAARSPAMRVEPKGGQLESDAVHGRDACRRGASGARADAVFARRRARARAPSPGPPGPRGNSTYDPEPLPDVPLEFDLEFQALQGLMMMRGKAHGLRTNRSRAAVAAATTDDLDLFINLSGPLQVAHGQQELVLGAGEAVLVSLADVYSFVHRPPGGLLALSIPRQQFAPLMVRGLRPLLPAHTRRDACAEVLARLHQGRPRDRVPKAATSLRHARP